MKRLVLLTLIALTAMSASAYDRTYTTDGGAVIYLNELSKIDALKSIFYEVTYKDENYNSYSGVINMPDSWTEDGYTCFITQIGEKAFYNCGNLTFVGLPGTLISIENEAFCKCTNLLPPSFPQTLTTIGEKAFSECKSITSLYLEYPKEIGKSAFASCIGLTSVTLPESLTTISEMTFSGCTSLTSVTLGDNVTTIGDAAFSNCRSLKSFDFPNYVTTIGNDAFYGCIDLTSINIPSSVTEIKNSTFYSCSSLTSVYIPSSITAIQQTAFFGCDNLQSIEIPNSVTTIGESAFDNCYSLKSLYVYWETPISIPATTFKHINLDQCVLYVPKGTYDLYKGAPVWKDFKKIREFDGDPDKLITLSINHNNEQIIQIFLKHNECYSFAVPQNCKKLMLNEIDVTRSIVDGIFNIEYLTENATLSVYLETLDEDVNHDGEINSLDALKVYKYMQTH